MHGLKKFFKVIFALAGFISLAALGLSVYGPWTSQARALFALDWYAMGVQVCMAILGFGLFIYLVRALLSRKDGSIVVDKLDGGQLVVSREAIASQAAHIVEADGSCTAADVAVYAKRKGHVRVGVRVLPHSSVDVIVKGQELHDQLMRELSSLCGEKLETVSLEFLEPEIATDLTASSAYISAGDPALAQSPSVAGPTSVEPTIVMSGTDSPTVIIEPSTVTNPELSAEQGEE